MAYQNPRVIGFSIVVIVAVFILSWYFYKKGAKDSLTGQLVAIDNQIANTRTSNQIHIKLLAQRAAIIEKLKSL